MAKGEKASKLLELKEALDQLNDLKRENQLAFFKPTEKQMEFYALGGLYRQRLLAAANQSGKTMGAAAEIAYHLTGRYPEWWPETAKRWTRPVVIWAAGVTGESTRDNIQRLLFGRGSGSKSYGHGMIPRDAFEADPKMAGLVADLVDFVPIKHVSGGTSYLYIKFYKKGREKFQGETIDLFWADEELPWDIYEEAMTRLNKRKGLFLLTFTPLMGYTKVVNHFLNPDADDKGAEQRAVLNMTIDDATFYTDEEKEDIIAQYPESSRRARIRGLPDIGEGLIFPVSDDSISCEPFQIPDHFLRIVGIDFGLDHPSALVWIAYDADEDIAYLTGTWKQKLAAGDIIPMVASAYRNRGREYGYDVPVAWPHDGLKTDPHSGISLRDLYAKEGINMMPESARYDDDKGGPQAREPGLLDMLLRMETGRFKVFKTCQDWFFEKNTYHRKEGKVVDYNDDLISASRYAMMMLRHAQPARHILERRSTRTGGLDFDPLELAEGRHKHGSHW